MLYLPIFLIHIIPEPTTKIYADVRRLRLKFKVGDYVFLKVSPSKRIAKFRKWGKLNPRFIGPYQIVGRVGAMAYWLELP